MYQHFDKFLNVEALVRNARPQFVLELGAGKGDNTRLLKPLCVEVGARLLTISDGPALPGLEEGFRQGISYKELETFQDGEVDVCLLDTDHNSWTVSKELELLSKKVGRGGWVLVHDTLSFSKFNGFMRSYGNGDPYRLEEYQRDTRTYRDAVVSFVGRGFALVKESICSAGAMALRRV